MHNLESEYLLSFASSLKFLQAKKWFFMFEGLKILLKEKSYYKKYKNIAAISIAEKNLLKRHFPQKNIFWIPPFYDTICINNESQSEKSIKELITKVKRKKVFLLTGTFGSGFNVKQTKWFINKVFKPLLKKNHNYLFIVAGLGSNQFFKTEDNIHVIPRYDSVAPLMKIADLVIILANGRCGVKLKLVEALSFRKKIVSSKDGVFGSGLENLIPNTDDEKEFSNYCIDALNNKINYSKAFDFFQENFDCLKNMKRLMGIKD
jgi:glycosyltransferase involved in cell wall biosynthesis